MSKVGDLLELLHGAEDRWTTVQTTVCVWRHAEDEARPTERRTRLWLAKPDRWRQEDDGRISVGRGRLWWESSPELGFMTNEDAPEFERGDPMESFGPHLTPARLIPLLSFVEMTPAGNVVIARVRPRQTGGSSFGLPQGADEHLLTIDAQRGVVLRIESFRAGRQFEVSQLEDVVYDDEIGDAVFELVPPSGVRVRSPRELHRVVTFEEAARFASFAVFAISELPPGQWRSRVHFNAAGGVDPESVYVTYHRADAPGSITLYEQPIAVPERRRRLAGPPQVVAERQRTRITIVSETYDEGFLRAIAEKLKRV
jgi:hypothetical protein